ncbi:hypothetical protein SI245_000746 [Escherichia coli]|nr:hypothetical protein [Escherichia coli]
MNGHSVTIQPLSGGAFLWAKKARNNVRANMMENLSKSNEFSGQILTRIHKAAQLRGLVRIAGCSLSSAIVL